MKYKVASLFAGVGGICLGFKQAKTKNAHYELSWANEIDKFACHTYRTNFSHQLIEGDLIEILASNNVDLNVMLNTKIDVLTGGFPCQPFSLAGKRLGLNDERGNLFLNIVDLINKMVQKPRVLFLENVKNLKSHDQKRTYEIIKKTLNDTGYFVFDNILNTANYSSLPQNRERIYIVGFLHEKDAILYKNFQNQELPNLKHDYTIEQKQQKIKQIIDFDSNEISNKYYYNAQKYPNYFSPQNGINLTREIDEMYNFYQCRRGMYIRKNMNNVCPTLTANMGTGGHNVPLIKTKNGIRKITPNEAFKLQGFPINNGYVLPTLFNGKTYSDPQLYKQAGNAVSVPVVKLLATKILQILESNDKLV